MLRKILTSLTAFALLAAVMPLQIRAEETGEEADTFDYYYITDEYALEVTCYANGGKFDPAKADGVSKDGTKRNTLLEVILFEDDDEEEEHHFKYTIDPEPLSEGLSRKNYRFGGWYTDKDLKNELETENYTGYYDYPNLYAKWIFEKGWLKTGEGWMYYASEMDYFTDDIYEINGKKYGFDLNGIMVTGWYKFNGKWHYFVSNGAMVTGWKKISNKWYWFDANGIMITGWKKISGKWYYFASGGAMVTGWRKIGGKWYYFQSSGAMKTGWLKLNGKWYYLDSSGAMVTGTRKIGSKTYTFSSSGVCLNP
ncbi:MAG: hypothetical protein K6G61_11780 [Solobacterium sp.]|nr:hypothetical protein [Solobacterium sp.]